MLISAHSHLSHIHTWLYAIFILVGTKIALTLYRAHGLRKRLPPGPRGLPLFGNAFQFTVSAVWNRLTEWQKEFGPIYSLNLAGQPVMVLNTISVAADLLDRRSHIYSDRPRIIFAGELMCGDMFMPFRSYGELWHKYRRASHEGLSMRAVQSMRGVHEQEAILLLLTFIRDPECWEENVKRTATSGTLGALYGWDPLRDLAHPIVQQIFAAADGLIHAALPGSSLIDIIPALIRIPASISIWKSKGAHFFNWSTTLFERMLDTSVKPDYSRAPSFSSKLLEQGGGSQLSHLESAWLSGSLFIGGTETTAGALATFLLAMLVNPEVMRRAQAELDEVVGREQLPSVSDQSRLPYISAIVKEVLRWRPIAPLGMARRCTQDDWYQGYFIPKGTTVIANIWAMHRDSGHYPDHEKFRPERFLDDSGGAAPALPHTHGQGHVAYGFGRRICVGMHLANQSLFLDVASMLWAFNVERANNEILSTEYIDSGAVARPRPFQCKLVPRFSDVITLVESAQNSG